ncbi:MAG: GC-type dockerin domain-anchored protein [Planctomycetota bacterium]
MHARLLGRRAAVAASLGAGCLPCAVFAQDASRARPIEVSLADARRVVITSLGRVSADPIDTANEPGAAGRGGGDECQLTSGYPSEGFAGGTYNVQAGFVENEIAAASYELSASLFPIRIDLIEALIGTAGTTVPTTTEYTVLVWDGTPDTGTLVASFSSDGSIIPHVEIPAGPAQAVNVNFLVDPGDPQQIFVNNTSGTNTFTIGLRIDRHNNQAGNGCFPAPLQTANAFPMTDTDGANQTDNWINAIDCGPLGCPSGWSSFQTFPALCRPTGDWMLRATWTSFSCSDQTGACCDGDGNCFDLTQGECDSIMGSYEGAGTSCTGFTCPIPEGACCLTNGNCLLLSESDCDLLSGEWQGGNSECNGSLCPVGAACLPDGTCIGGITELEAGMLGGTFLGVGTECQGVDCPQPRGACCIATTLNCLQFTEEECDLIPDAVWGGADSICDTDGDGLSDGRCFPPQVVCLADTNGDGVASPQDFTAWVLAYNNQTAACDQNGDGLCTPQDFTAWVGNYNEGC